jgi:hypothetical protein
MFKLISLSLVASAVAIAPASAQGTNQPAGKSNVTEKKICKQMPQSYTRHSNKVCLTAAEWKKLEQEQR